MTAVLDLAGGDHLCSGGYPTFRQGGLSPELTIHTGTLEDNVGALHMSVATR